MRSSWSYAFGACRQLSHRNTNVHPYVLLQKGLARICTDKFEIELPEHGWPLQRRFLMKKPGLVSFLAISFLAVQFLSCYRRTRATQNTSTGTENSSMSPSGSPEELVRHTIYRRAVEAVIWGTPAVNFDRMYQAMVHDAKAGEGSNKIVYWSRLFNWKNQTLTPNPDSIYFMPFFNTKNVGPVVLEIPPAD